MTGASVTTGGRPNLLPDGAELHRLRAAKQTWTEIGNRFGSSRQAAQKKWTMWKERQAKQGVTVENPFPRKTKSDPKSDASASGS